MKVRGRWDEGEMKVRWKWDGDEMTIRWRWNENEMKEVMWSVRLEQFAKKKLVFSLFWLLSPIWLRRILLLHKRHYKHNTHFSHIAEDEMSFFFLFAFICRRPEGSIQDRHNGFCANAFRCQNKDDHGTKREYHFCNYIFIFISSHLHLISISSSAGSHLTFHLVFIWSSSRLHLIFISPWNQKE